MANINAEQLRNIGFPMKANINPATTEGKNWQALVDQHVTGWVSANPDVLKRLLITYGEDNATDVLTEVQQNFYNFVMSQLGGAGVKGGKPGVQ